MTPPAKRAPAGSAGYLDRLPGLYGGGKKGGTGPKAAPAKPKAKPTPVENNEAGIIKFKGLTFLTNAERGHALRAGDKAAGWSPFVGLTRLRGTHKPKVPTMRPDPSFVPDRAAGTVTRPAGKGPVAKTNAVPKPNNALGVQPRAKAPDYVMAMGLTVTYGGETKINGGKPIDANYFTDAHLL